MAKNTVEKTKAKMQQIAADKARELEEIQAAIERAQNEEKTADQQIADAVASTDIAAYMDAKARKTTARTTAEMYEERRRQLHTKKFVTEEESDRVIDALLEFEDKRAAAFINAIRPAVDTLAKLQAEYSAEILDAEQTIKRWTEEIHANYSTRGRVCYPSGTDRSATPCPVHAEPYTGSTAAQKVEKFLQKIRPEFEA